MLTFVLAYKCRFFRVVMFSESLLTITATTSAPSTQHPFLTGNAQCRRRTRRSVRRVWVAVNPHRYTNNITEAVYRSLRCLFTNPAPGFYSAPTRLAERLECRFPATEARALWWPDNTNDGLRRQPGQSTDVRSDI